MRRLAAVAAVVAAVAWSAVAAARSARAEDLPLGTGTPVGSGSKITTSVETATAGEDVDQYFFQGFEGQNVTLSVKAARSSALLCKMDLIAPDGRTVDSATPGAKFTPKQPAAPGKSLKLVHKLPQTGLWTVRIRGALAGTRVVKGDNPATPGVTETWYLDLPDTKGPDGEAGTADDVKPTTGEYSFSVKYAPPPAKKSPKNLVPDDYGIYEFLAPAAGGSTLTVTMSFRSSDPRDAAGGTPTLLAVTGPGGVNLDASGYVVPKTGKSVTVKSMPIPRTLPTGAYRFEFQSGAIPSTKVSFKSSVKLGTVVRALKTKMSALEPTIVSVTPREGGPSEAGKTPVYVTVRCSQLSDALGRSAPRVFLGRLEMTGVVPDATNTSLTFSTPADLPDGVFDVTVLSTTGQAAVLPAGFRVVPKPVATGFEPKVGSSSGGFRFRIVGENFSTTINAMRPVFHDGTSPLEPPVTYTIGTGFIEFDMPALPIGSYRVAIKNMISGRTSDFVEPFRLEMEVNAAIDRVVPGLVPVLGGDTLFVNGSNFAATDEVHLETAPGSGTYEKVASVFVDAQQHTFVAPPRAKGLYRVFVKDENQYSTPTRAFSYYAFENFTASMGLTDADGYDAYSTALADYDGDGDEDLFLARLGNPTTKSAFPLTRVFRNDGAGALTDVTASVMPPVAADDDWRADRIRVADVDLRPESSGSTANYFPDIVICTDSDRFPTPLTKPHVRILANEKNAATGGRVFRDRTSDLIPPPRTMSVLWGGGAGGNDVEDWRAKDLWLGDVDLSNTGPPEIVITTDRVLENYYVSCTPYCASPYSGGYTYSFYWGGTRLFKWDATARSGLGRYKLDANYFPRKSGVTVPVPGFPVTTCTPGQCRGTFTPFTGQRLAVGDLNADGRPDFAVLNSLNVLRSSAQISSLQVGINTFRSGFQTWDVTDDLTGLGGATFFKGDTVAIGRTGFEDTDGYGVIAVARATTTGVTGSALRLVRAMKTADPVTDVIDFDAIDESLPQWTVDDRLEASAIEFLDIDEDGDDELLLVAKAPPGGTGPALRIFRNEIVDGKAGTFTRALDELITPHVSASEHFEGVAVALGDLDGDGSIEFVVTRDGTSGAPPHTRALAIDK